MFPFRSEKKQPTADLSTVESLRNDLVPEEFPEGSYGSTPMIAWGKSSPWRDDQRAPDAFGYENRELHEGMERAYPGDRELGDEASPAKPETE
jgi:hypothetical protein